MRLAAEAEAEEQRNRLRDAALIGWQLGAGGKGKSHLEYLRSLGLGFDDDGKKPLGRAVSKDESMASAERALAYFRTHPKRVEGRGKQIAEREKRRARRGARRARSGR